MKAKNGAGPGSGPAYSPQKQRPLSCATGARPRPQKMLMIHQYICNPRIVGTCLRHVDVFAWISMAPCQRHGPARGGMPFRMRVVATRDVSRSYGLGGYHAKGIALRVRGYALLTSPGETRPGTCRAPIVSAGNSRAAFLWVAGGEKERGCHQGDLSPE